MLRILDARTGESVAAAPARRGLTRIEAHASRLDPTALRVLLTADLLVRALELGGTPVWTTLIAPGGHARFRAAASALALHPFEDGDDIASGPGEAQLIRVREAGTGDPSGEARVTAEAQVSAEAPTAADVPATAQQGSKQGTQQGTGAAAAPVVAVAPVVWTDPGPSFTSLLADPTALRLALLSVPRTEPARLDGARLERGAEELAHWRRAVAEWARTPSRPVPEELRTRLRTAWDDDLDLPAVLAVLRDVAAAPDLPDGARFETYAYADRLLALDLSRDIGSLA
ncbi:hypothetical protein [Streptomyces sp. NPDC051452]|uniref:hypothetical protein n=1 Tax=Streptomyces sp. NPDC051452 TaxID=3365654 RepID=UPI003798A829